MTATDTELQATVDALLSQCKTLRDALRSSGESRELFRQAAMNQSRHVGELHRQYAERLTKLEFEAEARLRALEKSTEEIGRVADRSAQLLTVYGLSLPARSPEQDEDLADQVAYHDAHRESDRETF